MLHGVQRVLGSALAALPLALPAVAAAAEQGNASLTTPLIKLALGLVGVVAALLLFSRVLPRLNGLTATGHAKFRVLASLPVGQRERIVLMQAGQKQIVVGVAPGRVNALHVLDESLDVDAANKLATGLEPQAWLARALAGRRR